MGLIIQLLLSSLAVYLTALILPGVEVKNGWTAIGVALVIGLLNTFVRPLMVIITIPATILTLGLFLFVINAVIILLASYFLNGFQVSNFWWALLFSIIMSIISQLLNTILYK
jgi:putative membrane protein